MGVWWIMITKKQLDTIERFADKLWAKVGLDIEFTRHFLDRVNDARNKKQITGGEIQRLFKQSFRRHGKKISALGKGAEAVIKDMETDINMPFVLQLDKNGEIDLIAKTVMRKKDFKTSNKKFTVESGAGEQGTDELSYKYRKDTPGQSSNGKNMKEKQSDKSLDIKSLEKLIKSPSPRMVKMYGKSKYIDMLKKKLAKLKETIEESTLNYGRTMKAIDKERKMKNISAKDKATLGKIADLMKQLKAEDAVSLAKENDVKESVDLKENRAIVYNPKMIRVFIKKAEKKFPKYKGEIQQAEKDEIVFPNDPKLIKFFKGAREVKFVLSDSVEEGFYADSMSPKEKKRLNSIYKEMDKNEKQTQAAIKKGDVKTVDKLSKEYHKLRMQVVNFYNEDVELEEAVKFWKVTITKKAGKLFKGQTVDVKARNSAEAIKKGIKQMKGNPALVPSGSVDAVLGESTDIEENIGVKDGRRVVVKALTKPAALRLKKKLRNKFSSWDTSIDKSGLSMIVPNEKPIIRYLQKQPEVDTIGESTEIHENKETESELQEAAPFKSLEQKWLATKGDKKKQERLIKKHSLKPLISKVRPGAVKLGVLNDLSAKGTNNATFAGLDADGELIFVTNNPTKIYYAKKGSKRPKGMELEDVDLETLRLQRMVEVATGEKNSAFISEAGVDLTWTPSMIQKEYKKYLGNS